MFIIFFIQFGNFEKMTAMNKYALDIRIKCFFEEVMFSRVIDKKIKNLEISLYQSIVVRVIIKNVKK